MNGRALGQHIGPRSRRVWGSAMHERVRLLRRRCRVLRRDRRLMNDGPLRRYWRRGREVWRRSAIDPGIWLRTAAHIARPGLTRVQGPRSLKAGVSRQIRASIRWDTPSYRPGEVLRTAIAEAGARTRSLRMRRAGRKMWRRARSGLEIAARRLRARGT